MKRRRPRYWSPEPYQRVEMQQQTIEELRLVATGGRPPEAGVTQLMELGLVAIEGAALSLTAAGRHWVRRGAPLGDVGPGKAGPDEPLSDARADSAGGEAPYGEESPPR